MNIIYSKTTKERIDLAIQEAVIIDKEIEKIQLSRLEYNNLKHQCTDGSVWFTHQNLLVYRGIKLEVLG